MKKKLLVMCCVFTMITAMLAGCGGKGNNSTETPSDATVTETASDTEATQSPVIPDPVEEGDFIYRDDTKTEIIGLTEDGKNTADLIFPEYVTKIVDVYVPAGTYLHSIYFMNPDVELENVTFSNSNVEVVSNFPTTLTTIPANMFSNCTRLTTIGDVDNVITIPDNITSIEGGAFSGCESITKVVMPDSVTTIEGQAFQGCIKLKDVTYSNCLETIGDAAFFATCMPSVTLPDSVVSIGSICFAKNTALTDANISNVETVGQNCFSGCTALTNFTAKSDFDVVSPEGNSNSFEGLFEGAKVTVNIKDGVYKAWLKANPDSNITVK